MEVDKIRYFEYFLHKVVLAYGRKDNDLSRLKIIKLLFFATAARSKPSGDNLLLSKVFDNFVAMPYGHVESDIYNSLRNENPLQFYRVDIDMTTKIKDPSPMIDSLLRISLDETYLREIDLAVNALTDLNEGIFSEPAFTLVELSHQWYSWKKNYQEALSYGKYSQPIPHEDIIQESKIFTFIAY